MTTAELLAELDRYGIKIEAHSKRLRYSPRASMTPELRDALRAHKPQLLAILKARELAQQLIETDGFDPWQTGVADIESCRQCGTLEMWQTMTGNWRCMACNPPIRAIAIMELAERLRTNAT